MNIIFSIGLQKYTQGATYSNTDTNYFAGIGKLLQTIKILNSYNNE